MTRAFVFLLLLASLDVYAQSAERIESEYKLGVPKQEASALWTYLQSEAFLNRLRTEFGVEAEVAVERFTDVYFDDDDLNLYHHQAGLRFRSRYVDGELTKQLVQLKTPLLEDGVARTETKFDIKNSRDKNDVYARHHLMKYIKKRDRRDLNYQLAKFNSSAARMHPEVKLSQIRARIYIADSLASLATITLDEVKNLTFPFQKFTELELELNEIRYTHSSVDEKMRMEGFNEQLKNVLLERFPSLYQDQTPKYNKMKQKINASWLSGAYTYRMWIVFFIIVGTASFLFFFRQ